MKNLGMDPKPVENLCGVGTPDINWVRGWVELKVLPRWPVRPSTPVSVTHFTHEQRNWIRSRHSAGGMVHVVLKIGRIWLLLDGLWAAVNLGEAAADRLRECSIEQTSSVDFLAKRLKECR